MKSILKLLGLALLAVILGGALALWMQKPQPLLVREPDVPRSSSRTVPAPVPFSAVPSELIDESLPILPPSQGAATLFRNMGVLERNRILAEIQKQDFPTILQSAVDADKVEHDPMKHKIIIQTVLPNAMKLRPPGPEFLAQLRDFINDPANSKLDREMMLGALGEVQSPALTSLLHELYAKQTDPQLRAAAAGGIAMLGAPDGRGPQEQREQSTMGLEQIWRNPTSDKDMVLLRSLANGIAVGGAGSGIELLLQAALAPAGKDDARKTAALGALRGADILNSHAVPPLAARLSADNPTGEASKLARDVLMRMVSTPDAARALLAWMQTADANTAPMARDLVLRTENPEIWQAALNPAVSFRSEAVREAIRTGLTERRAGTSVGYPAGTRRGN